MSRDKFRVERVYRERDALVVDGEIMFQDSRLVR